MSIVLPVNSLCRNPPLARFTYTLAHLHMGLLVNFIVFVVLLIFWLSVGCFCNKKKNASLPDNDSTDSSEMQSLKDGPNGDRSASNDNTYV